MARVLRVNEADRMRPVVGILDEEGGEREMQILDLLQEPQLAIRSLAQRPRVPPAWLDAERDPRPAALHTQQWIGRRRAGHVRMA